ncbi:MAG: hypothetical protein QOF55_1484 [Thermoleophilaceae bacterium]|nr:hypothetical protein [Thermoleophilaceae bacterium]
MPRPHALARVAVPAGALTFSDLPTGTAVTDQYLARGVRFTSDVSVVVDGASPTTPVLAGKPRFFGPVDASFTVPGSTTPATVNGFTLDVAYIDRRDSVVVDYFDAAGALVGSRRAQALGVNRVSVAYRGIARFSVRAVSDEPAGFGVDNLTIQRGAGGIAPTRMASLGDSYSSGEGLVPEHGLDYDCGTDLHLGLYLEDTTLPFAAPFVGDDFCDTRTGSAEIPADLPLRPPTLYENLCHRHRRAYPLQIRDGLGVAAADSVFTACSGATTANIGLRDEREAQYDQSPGGVFGAATQIDDVRAFAASGGPPDLVTVGIGGNDAGFGGIALRCLVGDCVGDRDFADGALNTINGSAADHLRETFLNLRAEFPAATILAFGYPSVIGDPRVGCVGVSFLGVGIVEDERRWIRDVVLPAINAVVEDAAAEAGITYVDITAATRGHELCTSEPWINGLRFGDDIGPVGSESFHPNQHAHDAIARFFLDHQTDGAGRLLAPDPDPSPPLRAAGGPEIAIGTLSAGDGGACDAPCTRLHLSGDGFGPNVDLRAILHSDPVDLGLVRTDGAGSLDAELPVPAGVEPGLHAVILEGTGPGGKRQYGTALVRVGGAGVGEHDGDPARGGVSGTAAPTDPASSPPPTDPASPTPPTTPAPAPAPAPRRPVGARVRILAWRGRTLRLGVTCPRAAPSPCRIRLQVRGGARHRVLARAAATLPAGGHVHVTLQPVAARRHLTLAIATTTSAGTVRASRRLRRSR